MRNVRGRGEEMVRTARRRRWISVWIVATAGVLATACIQNDPPDTASEPVPATMLRVDNQAFLDMTIYVLRSSQQIRLGIATGSTVTRFTIPRSVMFGATQLAFFADPIGGRRTPVSQEITVSPGDEVQLIIPPR